MNNITFVGKNSNIIVKNFDTIDEFQNYYNLHKDEIDNYSTTKLNRMFKIKDHKITRRTIAGKEGKTLCFRQLLKCERENNCERDARALKGETNSNNIEGIHTDEVEQQLDEMNNRIKVLELENAKIKKQLLEIIDVLNS